MRGISIVVLLIALGCGGALGSDDYQARFLYHHQPKDTGCGFAAWIVVPDAMHEPSPRFMGLGGLVFKQRQQWVELLAGGMRDPVRGWDPVLDVRFSSASGTVGLFGNASYSFQNDKALLQVRLTRSGHLGRQPVRFGGEAEAVVQRGDDIHRAGPAVVFPLRHMGTSSLAVAYYPWSNSPRVVRTYLLFQF